MRQLLALLILCNSAGAQVVKQTPGTNALTVTTNANLTGEVTSVGNAATVAGPLASLRIVSSQVNFTSSATLTGTTDGFAAAAGKVGEVISANGTGTVAVPATTVEIAVATVTVTAGSWMVCGQGGMTTGGTTAATFFRSGVSSTVGATGAVASGGTYYDSRAFVVSSDFAFPTGCRFFDTSATTSYYLIQSLTYTVAGGAVFYSANARLTAVRIR